MLPQSRFVDDIIAKCRGFLACLSWAGLRPHPPHSRSGALELGEYFAAEILTRHQSFGPG